MRTVPRYDAHNHLQDARLGAGRTEILASLASLGVARCVVNGTREEDWEAVSHLARISPRVMPSFGLHPWYVNQRKEGWLDRLASWLDRSGGAVGEIGLDRWVPGHDPRFCAAAEQEEAFLAQLRLAATKGRPVTIHCLKAWGRLLELLQAAARARSLPPFLLHSYGGPAEMLAPFTQLGGYFSISGYFARAGKAAQREVFRQVPLHRLLVETDAPDMLPPEAWRRAAWRTADGTEVNHPANIVAVYEFAAELRQLGEPQFSEQMAANFASLFGQLAPTLHQPGDHLPGRGESE